MNRCKKRSATIYLRQRLDDMRISLIIAVIILLFGCGGDDGLKDIPYNPEEYVIIDPPGYPRMAHPDDNQPTIAGVDLGRQLFYDPLLSVDGSKACGSCHLQQSSFTDDRAISEGVNGLVGTRSSMSLIDVGYNINGLFWDGSSSSLEDQALHPIEQENELGHSWDEVVNDLRDHETYPELFRKAFGIEKKGEITRELTVKAIAQFERTLVSSGTSKYDRAQRGVDQLSDIEFVGHDIFFDEGIDLPDGQCFHCHSAPNFTDNEYHNNGLDEVEDYFDFKDLGRGEVSGIKEQNGAFRTPTLRNIELTAPYMHDGRFETLEEVLDHYISGGHPSPNKSPFLDSIHLTDFEKSAVLAFLKTLTDEEFINNEAFSDPF